VIGGTRLKVALLAASPIPYRVPLYQRLAADPRIDLTVIYASNGGVRPVDAGYGRPIRWDSDLLSGYRSMFLRRARTNPIEGNFLALRDVDVVKVLRQLHCDVFWIWGYNYLTHQLAVFSHILRRTPIIYSEEQTLIDRRPLWKLAIKRPILQFLFHRSSALFIGTENYRWFSHYGVSPERLHFTPYCVDNDKLALAHQRLLSRKDQLKLERGIRVDSGPVILMVARLIPKKQPLLLLEAFGRVRRRRRCTLLIVGTGLMEEVMRRKVMHDGLPDVIFAGFVNQSEIASAYACADIFVLPSGYRETWGLVVNEAMNCKLPVVVSDKVGCAVDLVKPDENGYIFRSDRVDELAECLMRLVDSPEQCARFGENSSKIVSGWNYEVAVRGVLSAVLQAVDPDVKSIASRVGRRDK
jgi:glycosyltransferase involved in cell wall biosynthesis